MTTQKYVSQTHAMLYNITSIRMTNPSVPEVNYNVHLSFISKLKPRQLNILNIWVGNIVAEPSCDSAKKHNNDIPKTA